MLLKNVVVRTKEQYEYHYEGKELDVLNNEDTGVLAVRDLSRDKDKVVALFNKDVWLYWMEDNCPKKP
jgi:hypothetical protein